MSVAEAYVKLSPLEHVLSRPDVYVGGTEETKANLWVYDEEIGKMKFREVSYLPALYKIFDEILVNSIDATQSDDQVTTIRVDIKPHESRISVFNDGCGIPIDQHPDFLIPIPELIFGHLRTSSNYNDTEQKRTGGRNGFGAKLANIFSSEFTLDIANPSSSIMYHQQWNNNMFDRGTPELSDYNGSVGFVKVSFVPDLVRFGIDQISSDMISVMKRRVYDIAGCNPKISVWLNGEELFPGASCGFLSYSKLFIDDDRPMIYEKNEEELWEIAITNSNGEPQQVSFVNSINTHKGGSHIDLIQKAITKEIITKQKIKGKKAALKPHHISQQTWIFVNCHILNPSFDSQTKESLTTKLRNHFNLSEKFLTNISTLNILSRSTAVSKAKANRKVLSAPKKDILTGIPKLLDAPLAGTRYSGDCTLILTEGDSAKSLAVSGLSEVDRRRFGVFPLRGKLLNVRSCYNNQILKNEELSNIVKILGLKYGEEYTAETIKTKLRYGNLLIMTDQDEDGYHIKGLILNFLHVFWPSLIHCNSFVEMFITPIIKATKKHETICFFTLPEFIKWEEEIQNSYEWKIKYYKGLGTNTSSEGKQYFRNLNSHRIPIQYQGDEDDELLEMVFSRNKADERKEWINSHEEKSFVDHRLGYVSIRDLVNKELCLFSVADNRRCIPSLMDGLKPVQRKILHCCFKRNLRKEIKVAQLAGYVAENSAYHHGEMSLTNAIMGMAQTFVGSNNINLLFPGGQFGTRLFGGKDSASPRYVFTKLESLTHALFMEEDFEILEYLKDDALLVEPVYFLPIVPMILVNGCEGIGYGWSSSIPSYNPEEIISNLFLLLDGFEPKEMDPWCKGFKGYISKHEKGYSTEGIVRVVDEQTIHISELPVGTWVIDYRDFLNSLVEKTKQKDEDSLIINFTSQSTDQEIFFVVTFLPNVLQRLVDTSQLMKKLRLSKTRFSLLNMHLFDATGRMKKYSSAIEILKEFYVLRLGYYEKRRECLIEKQKRIVERFENVLRFIQMIKGGELNLFRPSEELINVLHSLHFAVMPVDDSGTSKNQNLPSYEYLLNMPIVSFTTERVNELKQKLVRLKAIHNYLISSSPRAMWKTDLSKLQTLWNEQI